MADVLLEAVNLGMTFHQGEARIELFRALNFSLAPGEQVAIVGQSGCGKTTLLNLLGGLDTPCSGEVRFEGQNLARLSHKARNTFRNQKLGFIFQMHYLLREFTALENVTMPLALSGLERTLAQNRARAMLKAVGLGERITHRPSELSGGERQRVAIARALVTQPDCVLADEPTGNLDPDTAAQVESVMMHLARKQQTAFIMVTHDPQLAARMDRQYILQDGALTER